MLNLIRKFLRPTLREQLEDGVREALRRYAERRSAPDLRVFVSTDLVPAGVDATLWARDEAEHLRRFARQWAEDNGIVRAGLRLEIVLLDTKREFAFVKPLGLTPPPETPPSTPSPGSGEVRPIVARAEPAAARGDLAVLDVVETPAQHGSLQVNGELVVGRKTGDGVHGMDDRYMSGRHARLRVETGRVWVTDLDSKNRTYVNDQPLPPHQAHELRVGDMLRLGTTVLRLSRIG
jgi:hypothetical protein